ncbi:hypothetical protein FBD94_20035 [Pedobacter hiemivivus]|uniref:Uncharacterized protein n=1 Tax=Pedobacter hiemivivus TaxID=2530454 RepID=A0A4R0NA75_9SPHI|nr:hypothetical protein [Pedobacter hiemivivus]TCC97005.1 hypothetical protein EZ444_09095 [Pedobacter hiemivivus]TKC57573.1 hypothetical protein FBD94_20035 [Pedobacter hiemivivus]
MICYHEIIHHPKFYFLSILSTIAETNEYDAITNTHAFYQSYRIDTDRISTPVKYRSKYLSK